MNNDGLMDYGNRESFSSLRQAYQRLTRFRFQVKAHNFSFIHKLCLVFMKFLIFKCLLFVNRRSFCLCISFQ